jgi:UDP-2,3-diacylglucosamine pyrophosphatase LpxH
MVDMGTLFGTAAGLLAGAASGAGMLLMNVTTQAVPGQWRRDRALDKALQNARSEAKIPLGDEHRYIIFSDHHKGARNPADNFQQCETTYLAALDYYLDSGYTLIILGDAEELWEEKIPPVIASYRHVLEKEAAFYPDRYIRISGNHDNAWEDRRLVEKNLGLFFPGIEIRKGLVFQFPVAGGSQGGEIFLAHGHQGTLDSDFFDFIPQLFLPLYRQFQNLTGLGRTSPSRDACLRSLQDTQMYQWASRQPHLILIAGHTHRPVWSSMTHLEKLVWQLKTLLDTKEEDRPADFAEQAARLAKEIKERQEKYPPCSDTIKTRPCYFNTGCCRFEDGDITGIEIENGQMRLIKWGGPEAGKQRTPLEETSLADLFIVL